MAKRVTMKDIAEAAQVSLATVSYVLNNTKNQNISEETRIKILNLAEKMNYVPNYSAIALASKKSKLIGIIISNSSKERNKFLYYDLIDELKNILTPKGIDVVLMSSSDISQNLFVVRKRNLEAVLIIDISEEDFLSISEKYIVPIILIDSFVKNEMFFIVSANIKKAYEKAINILGNIDFLITEKFNNEIFMNSINSLSEKTYIYHENDDDLLHFLEKNKGKKGIIIGELLSSKVLRYSDSKNIVTVCFEDKNTLLYNNDNFITISNKDKAIKTTTLLEELLNERYDTRDKITYIDPK